MWVSRNNRAGSGLTGAGPGSHARSVPGGRSPDGHQETDGDCQAAHRAAHAERVGPFTVAAVPGAEEVGHAERDEGQAGDGEHVARMIDLADPRARDRPLSLVRLDD